MSYSGIGNQEKLGKFLQIAYSKGLRSQISQDFRDWEQIKMAKVDDPNGRQINFLFKTSNGPASVQYRNPNFTADFPTAQQLASSEHTAYFKEIATTIELQQNLIRMAQMSPAKYAEPLAAEMESKLIVQKRRLAADLYGDGTGVVGTVTSESTSTPDVTVTLNQASGQRGHVGFFEFGDLLLAKTNAGAAKTPTVTGTFYAWQVKSKNRKLGTVVLNAINSAGTVLPVSDANLDATDVFYRVGQPTIPDLTSPIADYGTVTEVIPGLDSLVSNDGRIIHGITMSGAAAGTVLDCSADPLDVSQIQELMDNVKINVGQSSYAWKKLVGAPEANAAFIESRETDRRFQSIDDNKRGLKVFCYVHQNDTLEVYTSEFCPKTTMYTMPEKSGGERVLEFHGTDFETVKANEGDSPFHLKPSSSGGHERRVISYMDMYGTLICKQPAAIGKLVNFGL